MNRINRTSLLANIALAILLASPIATALSRNIAFPMLIATTALLISAFAQERGWQTALSSTLTWVLGPSRRPIAALLALATIIFALASLLWSPAPERGFGAVAQTTVAALAAFLCCVVLARSIAVPSWLIWALPVSLAAACALILLELALDFPLRSALGGSPQAYRFNRSAIALALLLPLVFLHVGSRARVAAAVLVAALIVWTVFQSESESAKLAVIIIVAVTALSFVLKARTLALTVGIVVIASHILAPAIVILLYRMVAPETVASLSSILTTHPNHFIRLEIWWAYALEVLDAPLFGLGMQASFHALDTYQGSDAVMLRGLEFIHPHNVSLQTWYELGLVGILLTAGLMTFLLRKVLLLPERLMRSASIVMAGVWSVAYVSHGAWQHWWWALVGIVAVLLLTTSKAGERPVT